MLLNSLGITHLLRLYANKVMNSRKPDFVVGINENPYLHRWRWVRNDSWAANWIGNIYVHKFFRSDDDRALHDHPYNNISIILESGYHERLMNGDEPFRDVGGVYFRYAEQPHRVMVIPRLPPPVTIFICFRRRREWGFHCPNGWIPWHKFLKDISDSGNSNRGAGCP